MGKRIGSDTIEMKESIIRSSLLKFMIMLSYEIANEAILVEEWYYKIKPIGLIEADKKRVGEKKDEGVHGKVLCVTNMITIIQSYYYIITWMVGWC